MSNFRGDSNNPSSTPSELEPYLEVNPSPEKEASDEIAFDMI